MLTISRKAAVLSIIKRLIAGERGLDRIKRQECKRFGISNMIKNPEILEHFPQDKLSSDLRVILLKKPTKTLSGVTPVAVMIQPQGSCKWGCIYCPINVGLAAKSYTGFEPAALRARQYNFDPYLQVSNRVSQLEEAGHPTDKCEIIIMGGTFLQMPEDYKSLFIKGIYDALNGFHSDNVEEAIKSNEKVKTHRAIGLTIETRPDVCTQYIPEMLSYGATRVELGVQHADDRIYKIINRGHRVKSVVDSTRELKNAAFKVLYHIMPGLPGSSPKKDVLFVKKLFGDTRFRPDMLKIYPCLVLKGTKLHEMAQRGKYAPYTSEEAADIISEFYRHIPKYVRVMRIQRDIPANKIDSGVKKSNLRELVENKIREKNITPREIRYREVGLQRGKSINLSGFHIEKLAYNASGGKEYFISYENDDSLIAGFIRLRLPLGSGLGTVALIRELHIYGSEVPIHKTGDVQHRGLGTSLLKEAEQISRDAGRENMKIISGVGVRDFYRKYGYELRDQYMAKSLSSL